MGARHNDPRRFIAGRLLGVVPQGTRHAWAVSEILEDGQHLLSLVLCKKSPNGALSPSQHRSVMRPDVLRTLAAVALDEGAR